MPSGRFFDYMGQGIAADRPATPDITADGIGLYYATDTEILSFYGGSPQAWENIPLGTLTTTFITLTDAPASYTGHATKFVTVKATEDGLEFFALTAEVIADLIGSYFHNGTGITAAYDDAGNQFDIDCTISQYTDGMADARIAAASIDDLSDVDLTGITDGQTLIWDIDHFEPGASAGYSAENARDDVGAALTEGNGIDIVLNDGADTITIGLAQGSSFPGSPVDGQRFWRTDLNMEFFYVSASSHWRTTQLFTDQIATQERLNPNTATGLNARWVNPFDVVFSLYLERVAHLIFVTGTGNWTCALRDATPTTIVSATTTGSLYEVDVVNAIVNTSQDYALDAFVTENSGTGSCYYFVSFSYRLVL